jgi:hypothetical protein
MGEIVDLESYRKKLQRKSARAPGAGSRRTPDRDHADDDPPGPRHNRREPRRGETGNAGPGGNAKVEPSGPESD